MVAIAEKGRMLIKLSSTHNTNPNQITIGDVVVAAVIIYRFYFNVKLHVLNRQDVKHFKYIYNLQPILQLYIATNNNYFN